MTLKPPHAKTAVGPLGVQPQTPLQLPRGPIGVLHVGDDDKSKGSKKQQSKASKSVKKLTMPAAAGDNKTKLARVVSWDLYDGSDPAVGDVKQGELKNCPLASLLAALAYTATGRKHLDGMIDEKTKPTVTDLTAVKDDLDEAQPALKLTGKRYFVVKLGGKSWSVSDVLYTDDADSGWDPIYMRSPTEKIWPCIVEKAYAKKEGGYAALDSLYGKGITLNEIWKAVTGNDPSGIEVTDKTKDRDLKTIARAAARRPTVAASKFKLAMQSGANRWHGFVVKGLAGSRIEVYDAWKLKTLKMSFKTFREDFGAVLYEDL